MRKHVLMIVENNPVPFDKRPFSEAKALLEFGYRVSFISPKGRNHTKSFEIFQGIKIYRHPSHFEGRSRFSFIAEYLNALFWQFILSIKIYITDKFYIIHSANPPDLTFIISLLYKPFGVKYIFDHHDIAPENYLAKFKRKDIFYYLQLLFEKLSFQVADLIISTNDSYKNIAISRGKKNENEVYVVRNGPDLSNIEFPAPNNNWRDGFRYLVGYVGTIGNQEGIDNLLRSVEYIVYKRKITNIKYIIVGTGTDWHNMVYLSKKMKLDKYVKFTGFIPYREFYEVLSTVDVCVNPEFRNNFTDKSTMIKIMDYMVFGKPIVQYETTEGKVTAGEAAIYVKNNNEIEFAERLLDLLNDPVKRKRMGRYGKERIFEKLVWDKQKINLKKAYLHLENNQN